MLLLWYCYLMYNFPEHVVAFKKYLDKGGDGKDKNHSVIERALDTVFSRHYRLSQVTETNHNLRCFCCNKTLSFDTSQCGHIVPRNFKAIRYCFDNVKIQCQVCNVHQREWGKLLMVAKMSQTEDGRKHIDGLIKRVSPDQQSQNIISKEKMVYLFKHHYGSASNLYSLLGY